MGFFSFRLFFLLLIEARAFGALGKPSAFELYLSPLDWDFCSSS